MKLCNITENVTVQGNIRISMWDDSGENETVVYTKDACDGLYIPKWLKKYADHKVLYMFAAPDGFLHIEIQGDTEG